VWCAHRRPVSDAEEIALRLDAHAARRDVETGFELTLGLIAIGVFRLRAASSPTVVTHAADDGENEHDDDEN
jgi:hypothetical protein